MTSLRDRDPHDVRLAQAAPAVLRAFNDAGVLSAADVQVARRLARLGDVDDDAVLLALALAVRAPRLGHVLVDLATIRATVVVDTEEPVDLGALPWPDAEGWVAAVAACPLVAAGEDDDPPGDARPLRLAGAHLYLDRYWREERAVAADLRRRAGQEVDGLDAAALAAALARLFPDPEDVRGRAAAETAVRRRLTVIAGGPGTGKTTAVGKILALLAELAGDGALPLVALAAPTGKAAAHLAREVERQADELDVAPGIQAFLRTLPARTLHRLLGARPGSRSRFRHDHTARLPHDVVIVDETSMVSLTMMSRLLDAVRPDARLILIGDPDQLSSIEAGAVLGDVVGEEREAAALLARSVVVLDRRHRYRGAIAQLADAVRRGAADDVLAVLRAGAQDVVWIPDDPATLRADARLAPVRDAATAAGRRVIAAARAGDGETALEALNAFRLLCAHRRGPHGVSTWMPAVEAWLAPEIEAAGGRARDYPGRPLLITANDYDLNLFNGDTGVVVAARDERLQAVFERRGGLTRVRPNQLGAAETVYAMTVHKAQGSQFGTAAVLLPPPTSRILTRELLYTAVTRAREQVIVVGTEDALRAALARPAVRASGLGPRLWDY